VKIDLLVEDQRADPFQGRELDQFLRQESAVRPDRAVRDAVVLVQEAVAGGLDRDRNRVLLRDRNGSRDPGAFIRDHIVAGRVKADPCPKGDRVRAPKRSARMIRDRTARNAAVRAAGVAAIGLDQERVVLDPNGDRDLEVVPDHAVALETVIKGDTRDLPLSESREQSRVLHRPNDGHVAVPGLCRNRQIEGVVPGQGPLPHLITKTRARRHQAR
jgi:hypothetical protein